MTSKFTEDNRRFFDDLASKYDIAPWFQMAAQQITTFTQQQLEFIGLPKPSSSNSDDISLLDYACGTGMMSRALGPYVSTIHALDLSQNMVKRYQELASSSSLASVKNATARAGDLLADGEIPAELSGSELHGFSIIAVGAALHHFADARSGVGKLAARLRPGGVLLIVDFVEEAPTHTPTAADHTIRKHGFTEREMEEMMGEAGLVDFGWVEMPERIEMKINEGRAILRTVFLARAARAA